MAMGAIDTKGSDRAPMFGNNTQAKHYVSRQVQSPNSSFPKSGSFAMSAALRFTLVVSGVVLRPVADYSHSLAAPNLIFRTPSENRPFLIGTPLPVDSGPVDDGFLWMCTATLDLGYVWTNSRTRGGTDASA
jgi:hypothetical protein